MLQVCSDGEINLPRALMIAGIPAAVVSQWKICDKTSSRLMEAFYKKLRCGQEVAKALQSAMLELSNDQGSKSAIGIFEWGPFLIWGFPNVKLPKELWTENARKTIRAREQVELLRDKFDNVMANEGTMRTLEDLTIVETFLEAVSCDACTIDDKDIARTVLAISSLLQRSKEPFVSDEVVAIAEEFYKVHLPLERVEGVELGLKEFWGFTPLSIFRYITLFYCACLQFPQVQTGDVVVDLDFTTKHQDPTLYKLLQPWSQNTSTRYKNLKRKSLR